MAILIAPLHMVHRVDQFPYIICPNRTPDEKNMGFKKFQIFEPTHTGQTGLAFQPDRYKHI
jgi:hypothetical protein